MEILFVLIGLSFFMALCGLGGFLWANASGQWSDLQRPALEILLEDPGIQEGQRSLLK